MEGFSIPLLTLAEALDVALQIKGRKDRNGRTGRKGKTERKEGRTIEKEGEEGRQTRTELKQGRKVERQGREVGQEGRPGIEEKEGRKGNEI